MTCEAESKHMEGTCALARNAADNTNADANDDDDDDLFADPDPLETFHLEYTLPLIKSVNEALALR
jgi:hypothetical protein